MKIDPATLFSEPLIDSSAHKNVLNKRMLLLSVRGFQHSCFRKLARNVHPRDSLDALLPREGLLGSAKRGLCRYDNGGFAFVKIGHFIDLVI